MTTTTELNDVRGAAASSTKLVCPDTPTYANCVSSRRTGIDFKGPAEGSIEVNCQTEVARENGANPMTPLETIQLILKLLTLLGLIGLALAALSKLRNQDEFLFYASLTVIGVSAALWIVVNMLIQR